MKKIYLYVKTHKVTGLKYFGKTTKKDPFKYNGSGTYWLNHLKKHGKLIDTEIIGTFEDEHECSKFALHFSIKNNILESKEWANLRLENGIDGAPIGNTFSEETIKKMSEIKKGKKPREYYVQIAKMNTGRKQTEYQKQRARENLECSWIITNPQGVVINIVNLRKFCKENNLDQGNMVKVSKGQLKQHKGWTCFKVI
jgi:hypothetical protein